MQALDTSSAMDNQGFCRNEFESHLEQANFFGQRKMSTMFVELAPLGDENKNDKGIR